MIGIGNKRMVKSFIQTMIMKSVKKYYYGLCLSGGQRMLLMLLFLHSRSKA
ncbi:hypothetical protein ACI2OX_07175 [Bacillus sp. N9]